MINIILNIENNNNKLFGQKHIKGSKYCGHKADVNFKRFFLLNCL